MKQNSKTNKIYLIVIAIALLFLLAVDATYAYFSAQKNLNGKANMGQLNLCWAIDGILLTSQTNVCNGTPDKASIARGDSFGLIVEAGGGYETTDSSNALGFYGENTSDCYVRFWVDAYKTNDTTNYGQYFLLNFDDDDAIATDTKTKTKSPLDNMVVETNIIYYLKDAMEYKAENGSMTSYVITGMKLAEDAPLELMNSSLTITINFDAVQQANSAFKTVFDDWRGYHSSWK